MTTGTGTAAQDATGRRDAARTLLQQPILTAGRDPDALALVRRHATALRTMFASRLGYTLVVEPTFARLVKAAPAPGTPPRPLLRDGGEPFGAATYAHLALVCAALLAPGIGDHVLVSALAEQVHADATALGIAGSDPVADRRQLVAALRALQDWGVLTDDAGIVDRWAVGDGEDGVLDVHRPLLAHVLAPAPDAGVPPVPARVRLYRRLVEDPVVARDDLAPDELDELHRDRVELAHRLDEDFGLTLEVRTEGALAYDADGTLTDLSFPGPGTLKQAALLLISSLIEEHEPTPGADLVISAAAVDAAIASLVSTHARDWRARYVRDPDTLRREITDLLADLHLAHPDGGGLVLHAPAARYRPTATERPDIETHTDTERPAP
ncbi:TIGR02678 family protein [Rhodococcus sp. HM1]|uniref:TIGR02678 family protein n=1 Tax=Rhodococcus sp. HM1 TaxID=2937759 RepID=UPI002009F415|nr:TIGR02678 family protein [Rhodococcus sp. HM1]MCK8674062.1 TIGR02678 family protein [Rhodococcus sp. HM1]